MGIAHKDQIQEHLYFLSHTGILLNIQWFQLKCDNLFSFSDDILTIIGSSLTASRNNMTSSNFPCQWLAPKRQEVTHKTSSRVPLYNFMNVREKNPVNYNIIKITYFGVGKWNITCQANMHDNKIY